MFLAVGGAGDERKFLVFAFTFCSVEISFVIRTFMLHLSLKGLKINRIDR